MRPPCQATVTRADRSAWGPRRRLRNRRRDLRITASLGGVTAGYRTGQPQTISALGANPRAFVRWHRGTTPPRLLFSRRATSSRSVWPAAASCHGFGAGPSPDRPGPHSPRARDAGADLSVFGAPERRALRAAIGATVAFYLGWIVIDDAVLAVFRNAERDRTPGTGRLRRRPRAAGTRLRACDGGRRCADWAAGTAESEHTCAAAGLLFVVALCVSLSTAVGRNVATARMASAVLPGGLRRSGAARRPGLPGWKACSWAAASRCWQRRRSGVSSSAEGAAGPEPRLTPLAAR